MVTVRNVRHSSSGVRWWPHRVVVVSHRTMSRSEAVCCGVLPAADVTSMEKGKKSPAFHFINSELLERPREIWVGWGMEMSQREYSGGKS